MIFVRKSSWTFSRESPRITRYEAVLILVYSTGIALEEDTNEIPASSESSSSPYKLRAVVRSAVYSSCLSSNVDILLTDGSLVYSYSSNSSVIRVALVTLVALSGSDRCLNCKKIQIMQSWAKKFA